MDNYRPISILNVFSKILEKLVHKRLSTYLETNNLLSKFQFGFRKNFSTTHPLTVFLNHLSEANNDKKFTLGIFCDLRKAFDTVDYDILLTKLFNKGIRGQDLEWFRSYLHGRKQLTAIGDNLSDTLDILVGVPQGSILGPLLFIIYMDDLPSCTNLYTLLFADDTTLYVSSDNLDFLKMFVNSEFKKVVDFFRAHKLSIHPDKTKFILFSHGKKTVPELEIFVDFNNLEDNTENKFKVEQVTPQSPSKTIKFLGVLFEQDLSFANHIKSVATKLSTALYFLRSSKNLLPESALLNIYYTLFHTQLVYANIIWSSTSLNNFNKLYKLQKAAIRVITNSKFNAHTEPLFKKLNILPLPLLHDYFCLDFMQQKHQNFLPTVFKSLFLTNREQRNNPDRELRNDFEYAIPPLRVNALSRFPAYTLPTKWNIFYQDPEAVEINILRDRIAFKKALKKFLLSKLKSQITCDRLFCPSCLARNQELQELT